MSKTYLLSSEIHLDAPLDRVFAFFSDPENLELITPPSLRFRVIGQTPIEMRRGTKIDYRLELHGFPMRWQSEIPVWDPPHRFVDRQLRGPYRLWEHDHRFEATDSGTRCVDLVTFEVPFGAIAYPLFVRRDLERIFAYRHRTLAEILGASASGDAAERLSIRPLPATSSSRATRPAT